MPTDLRQQAIELETLRLVAAITDKSTSAETVQRLCAIVRAELEREAEEAESL
jgi:hypothetical protein